ncbi:MAG: hypothetical protein WCG02_01465 [Candidatus Taylorbacteria bacterium]
MRREIVHETVPVLVVDDVYRGGPAIFANTLIMLGYQTKTKVLRLLLPGDLGNGIVVHIPPRGDYWRTLIGYETDYYREIVFIFKEMGGLLQENRAHNQDGYHREFNIMPDMAVPCRIQTVVDRLGNELVQIRYGSW